jgi:hypothetical protein
MTKQKDEGGKEETELVCAVDTHLIQFESLDWLS